MVAPHGGEEGGDINVGTDDGIQDPFETEVGDAFQAVFEGVVARDGDGRGWGKTFAREEAEESCLAGAVGWVGPERLAMSQQSHDE